VGGVGGHSWPCADIGKKKKEKKQRLSASFREQGKEERGSRTSPLFGETQDGKTTANTKKQQMRKRKREQDSMNNRWEKKHNSSIWVGGEGKGRVEDGMRRLGSVE